MSGAGGREMLSRGRNGRAVLVAAVVALVGSWCAWVRRTSVDSPGNQAQGANGEPAVSADGPYVAFYSGNWGEVFVRDTVAGTTTRVSVDSAGKLSVSPPLVVVPPNAPSMAEVR